MSNMLFDLHLDRNQLWHWFGIQTGSDQMIVSRRGWADRSEAALALRRFLQLLSR